MSARIFQISRQMGFTMVEIVVMLGILTLISIILLTGFPNFNENAVLARMQHEMALSIRRIQNIALSVANVEVTRPDGTKAHVTGLRTGLYVTASANTQYLSFVDSNSDGKYRAADDARIGDVTMLQRGIKVKRLLDENGISIGEATLLFEAPDAALTIVDANGASIGSLLTIEFESPNLGLTRSVSVRTSGQVSLD